MRSDDEFKPATDSLPMQTALGLFRPRYADSDCEENTAHGPAAADPANGSLPPEELRIRVLTLARKYRIGNRRGGKGGVTK